MRIELHACARTGWGPGVSDMVEANKYERSHQIWTDNHSKLYFGPMHPHLRTPFIRGGKRQIKLGPPGMVKSAQSCINFIEAVEERLGQFVEIMNMQKKLHQDLDAAWDNDWKRVGKLLNEIEKNTNRGMKIMWFLPDIKVVNEVRRYAGRVTGITGIALKIHRAADTIVKVQARGGSAPQGAALAIVTEMLTLIPILGPVYGAAVRWAIEFTGPAMETFMRDYWTSKYFGRHLKWLRPQAQW